MRFEMPTAADITQQQMELVKRWHQHPIRDLDSDGEGRIEDLISAQHGYNFLLWHEEDKARRVNATDQEIASVKRSIDQLNQKRNDQIEVIDDAIERMIAGREISVLDEATLNTETPGSVIDRLSIMALRLYHYREELQRDADSSHEAKVLPRIGRCQEQLADLSRSLQELLDDLFAGRKRHKTYRQMKMYNDPSLNPELYRDQP